MGTLPELPDGQGFRPAVASWPVTTATAESLTKQIFALERPHPALWTYYIISALLTGPGLLVTLPYLYFRYHTLKYRFDEEGIHMRVGILFRREVNLTYARIQDIHLGSNLIQRWLGLANVQIQTASGSAGAEMVIEGFKEFEAIRDFLYSRMRGYHTRSPQAAASSPDGRLDGSPGGAGDAPADAISLLQGIRDELRRTRELVETGSRAVPPSASPPPTS